MVSFWNNTELKSKIQTFIINIHLALYIVFLTMTSDFSGAETGLPSPDNRFCWLIITIRVCDKDTDTVPVGHLNSIGNFDSCWPQVSTEMGKQIFKFHSDMGLDWQCWGMLLKTSMFYFFQNKIGVERNVLLQSNIPSNIAIGVNAALNMCPQS